MSDLVADPRFWGAVAGALFVGFLLALVLLSALRGNDEPEVVGAIRQRCEVCEEAWAASSTDDDLDLCLDCRRKLDEAARPQAEREALR